ncbi:MAG: Hsp20 family protein [Chitinivibrionales bacterium]|nr:Hsp20 family protein [Chitinivibrionales bacterium]
MKGLIPWRKANKHAVPHTGDNWSDRMWNDPFDGFLMSAGNSLATRLPSVDISESKKEVEVKAELPGLTEKDIDLTWHNGYLRIKGEKSEEKEDKGRNRYFKECNYGCFSRDIPVGENVDFEKARARYKNGVLTVQLPKKQGKEKSITVAVD